MQIKRGCTRIVFVFKNKVVKIPNFTYSWQHFLKGLLANMTESSTWKWNSGQYETGHSHLLCPVLFCSWGGWFLIMKKADLPRHEKEVITVAANDLDVYIPWQEAGFGGDDKAANYGYYQDRLVKVDYGS